MKYSQALITLALIVSCSAHMHEKDSIAIEAPVEAPKETLLMEENSISSNENNAPENIHEGRIMIAPLIISPYSIIGGVPLSLYDPAAPSPQTRDIGASGGLNLGPLGAGFGAGVRPGGFYLGGGAGYSGNFFLPYNYQQHQAPYLYTRHFNQNRFF